MENYARNMELNYGELVKTVTDNAVYWEFQIVK